MDHLDRRSLLRGAAAGGLAAAVTTAGPPARAANRTRPSRQLTLTTTVTGSGSYAELPFAVPDGVTRIDVSMRKSSGQASLGIGLFDARGWAYQSAGFRGIYGAERSSFYVSTSSASEAFMPGPMGPGTWCVLVPVFAAPVPTTVTVLVTLSFGPQGRPFRPGPEPGVVLDEPGWYRGDLHCHTPASSDAWASGSAMAPAEWAEACRATGLDFAAMTDHNVVSQNFFLARDAGADVLLMPGEEMTNWFHGHATVSGIEIGQWLDFRQTPQGLPLPTGGARIKDFIALADSMGAYVSAAHPLGAHLSWQFQADAETDEASRTHGFEVWTGPWQPDDEAALQAWDRMLLDGWRTVANGGSDLHGVENGNGFAVGKPTTVVYAERLATRDVLTALKAGRCFVTRAPDGVELYLTARRPGQETYVGGTVYGAVGDLVTVQARVRRGGGMRLVLVSQAAVVAMFSLAGDDETVETAVPIPPGGGYVRAEVRGEPRPDPVNPQAGELDMEAFTNPIHLAEGAVPAGYVAQYAPVPQSIPTSSARSLPTVSRRT
ncbi:MAG: CehA/McbA family metallohydrolase [Actinomycetes bacterium]